MKHTLSELFDLLSGLPDPHGFPLRALMAGIAEAESRGDPDFWIAHDPPSKPHAGPSSGVYSVHQPAWPAVYAATEAVRLDPNLSDGEKIVRMTELARPIMVDGLTAAIEASRTLAARGIKTTALETALFVDAAWQTGAGHLASWARSTSTGDPREIVNPARTVAVEVALRTLAHEALEVAPGIVVALGTFAAFGLAAFALSQWRT